MSKKIRQERSINYNITDRDVQQMEWKRDFTANNLSIPEEDQFECYFEPWYDIHYVRIEEGKEIPDSICGKPNYFIGCDPY